MASRSHRIVTSRRVTAHNPVLSAPPMSNRFAWAFTTVTLFGSVAMIAACSDDAATTSKLPVTSGKDSSVVVNGDTGVADGQDGSVTTGDSSAGTCTDKTPPQVRQAGDGPFCPFQTATLPDGGRLPSNCAAGNRCCSAKVLSGGKTLTNSKCQVDTCGYADTKAGTEWQCAGPEHCGSGSKCYLVPSNQAAGGIKISVRQYCAPEFLESSFHLGTRCKSASDVGDYEVCSLPGSKDAGAGTDAGGSVNVGCPSGKVCTPFTVDNRDLGYCK